MTDINDLMIYIVSCDHHACDVFEMYFKNYNNVEVYHTDIRRFYREHKDVDCLVSPANAFGLLTGGYDAALGQILGLNFQDRLRHYIRDHFYGEQGVATSFIIESDIEGLSLIHTPTMRYPSVIVDDMVVYHCMRSTLMCALANNVRKIVIPIFGGGCGNVESKIAAIRMREAYEQIIFRQGPEYMF